MKINYFLFLNLFFVSFNSSAYWYFSVQDPSSKVDISTSQTEISYTNPTVNMIIPGFTGTGALYIAQDCTFTTPTNPHYTWDYIAFPSKIYITQKSFVTLSFNGASSINSGWSPVSNFADWKAYKKITTRNQFWGPVTPCPPNGYLNLSDTWLRGDFSISVSLFDGGDLKPALYSTQSEIKIAQAAATNTASSISGVQTYGDQNIINVPGVNFTLNVNIQPKCTVDLSEINLNHGDVSVRNADGNRSPSVVVNISCLQSSNVKLSLKGINRVSGYPDNVTDCSNGLVCSLFMNVGNLSLSEFSFNNIQSGTAQIYSELNLNSNVNSITPGQFLGLATLEVSYQ